MEFIRRNISEVLADLPEICAAHLPSDNSPILIKRGTRGYCQRWEAYDGERFNKYHGMGDQTVVEISLRTAADHFGRKLSRSVVRVVLRFAQLGTWREAEFWRHPHILWIRPTVQSVRRMRQRYLPNVCRSLGEQFCSGGQARRNSLSRAMRSWDSVGCLIRY